MKIIAIEEHWNTAGIRDALDRLPDGARDESVAFNTMGDNQARLEDIGPGRVEAMDAAGIDVSILSVVTPATQALPAREAVALARDANDEAASAVRAHGCGGSPTTNRHEHRTRRRTLGHQRGRTEPKPSLHQTQDQYAVQPARLHPSSLADLADQEPRPADPTLAKDQICMDRRISSGFMICRLWRGWTTKNNADAYERIVREEVIPDIEARRIPGFRSIDLVRREREHDVEFMTLMWFDSLNAVKGFMGQDYQTAHVPTHAQAVLADFDRRSAHYEVLDRREQPL